MVSCGGLALGAVAFGGVGLGLLGIGGLGVGVYAVGGGAVGWRAAGGLAIGWDMACGGGAFARHAAIGGVAIARDYALGGEARARHANDEAARAVFLDHPFMRFALPLIGQTEIRRLRAGTGVPLASIATSPVPIQCTLVTLLGAAEIPDSRSPRTACRMVVTCIQESSAMRPPRCMQAISESR